MTETMPIYDHREYLETDETMLQYEREVLRNKILNIRSLNEETLMQEAAHDLNEVLQTSQNRWSFHIRDLKDQADFYRKFHNSSHKIQLSQVAYSDFFEDVVFHLKVHDSRETILVPVKLLPNEYDILPIEEVKYEI